MDLCDWYEPHLYFFFKVKSIVLMWNCSLIPSVLKVCSMIQPALMDCSAMFIFGSHASSAVPYWACLHWSDLADPDSKGYEFTNLSSIGLHDTAAHKLYILEN